jgi:hypothetical protein
MQMTTVEEHRELTQETRFQVVLLTELLPKTKANYGDVELPKLCHTVHYNIGNPSCYL